MRTLTAATDGKVAQNLGVEPIIIVKIEWSSGTEYYSEKSFILGAISAQGKILSFNPLQVSRKVDTVGEAAGGTLVLDDTDGTLKIKVNTEIIEGLAVTAYQHFTGNAESDLTILFKGKIAGGIGWSEGERTLDISIDASVEDKEVGFAPDEDDVVDINPDAVGVPWPLCFGTVLHVPAVRVKREPIGHLSEGINQNHLEFEVQGADLFPQSPTVVQILINNILYQGTFSGTTFTVAESNQAHHTNIPFANRRATDPHAEDASVAWIATEDNIVGLYCYADTRIGYAINRCVRQEGNKCYFIEPWGVHTDGIVQHVVVGVGEVIDETAGTPRASWGIDFIIETVITPWPIGFFNDIVNVVAGAIIVRSGRWSLPSGADVKLKVSYNDLYVCNLLESVEILSVYGHRRFGGKDVFVPIPSSYYTKNLSLALAGQTVTALEFEIPLEEYVDENWTGDVYVSLRSSIGTNVTQILKWLIETYSNLTADTTFTSVAAKVGVYPANFAVFDQPNVLKLIEEISWQARCALVIRNGVVSIIYLSELTTAVMTLDESNLELKSLTLGFSETDDIITKLIGTWLKDYSGEKESERRVIYKNNIDSFNLVEEERNMFIYNDGNLAKLSIYFWGYRYSNSWRKAAFKAFLDALALEPFDTIEHAIAIFSTNTIRGIVEDTSQDSAEHSITLETELASKAGDSDLGQPIEDQNYWLGDPAFPVDIWNNPIYVPDPGKDLEEVDYTVPKDTDDGSGGDTGGDQSVPPPESQNALIIETRLILVERAATFDFRVTLRDAQFNIVNDSLVATLELSTAGDDVLTPVAIPIVNGEYQGTLTLDGGAGQEAAVITVYASGYQHDATPTFFIIPVRTVLAFVGPILDLERDVAQSTVKVLEGGLDGEIINIALNAAPGDKIYDSGGVQIATRPADVAGDFHLPADWYISGGQGHAVGQITFKDTVQKKYIDEVSNPFDIIGATSIVKQQSVVFTQRAIGNAKSLYIDAPLMVPRESPFALGIQIWDSDGDIDTSFNGEVIINLLDADKEFLAGLNWIDAGPNAQIYNDQIVVTITDGEWSYDECQITIPSGESLLWMTAEEIDDSDLYNEVLLDIDAPYFGIAIDTSSTSGVIVRGISYPMTVTSFAADGSQQTDYVPVNDPDISISGGDLDDEITPIKMGKLDWVDGQKTVNITITGGLGIDPTELTVEEQNRLGKTEIAVVASAGYTLAAITEYQTQQFLGNDTYFNSGFANCSPQELISYLARQNTSIAELRADTSLSILTGTPIIQNTFTAYGQYINQSYQINNTRHEYSISELNKAAAEAAFMVFDLSGCIMQLVNLLPPYDTVDAFFEKAGQYTFGIDCDYVGNKYASGAAMQDAEMPLEFTFAELNEKLIAVGGTSDPSSGSKLVHIPIPLAWIKDMPSTTILIWLVIRAPVFPKESAWCNKNQFIRVRTSVNYILLIKP